VDYPDGIVVYKTKSNVLLEQLQLEVLKVDPQPGQTILIQPRDSGSILPQQFCHWIGEFLNKVFPSVNIVINPEVPISVAIKEN
jgi:hypothetical protein